MKQSQISINNDKLNEYISQLAALERSIKGAKIKSKITHSKGEIATKLSESIELCNSLGDNVGYLISNTRKALIYAKKEMKSQDKKLAAKWKK